MQLQMLSEGGRRQHLSEAMSGLGLGAVLLGLTYGSGDQPAEAAKYGPFGGDYAGVKDPTKAIRNEDALKSQEVQAGIEKLRKWREAATNLAIALKDDKNADLNALVQKKFDVADLRITLNKMSLEVLDEDAQVGTDRLLRNIIQDIRDISVEAQIPEGKQRSQKRIEVLIKSIVRLNQSLDEFNKFFV